MKQPILTLVFLGFTTILSAQTAREEIENNVHCSASDLFAYPGPMQARLTPAPDGKKPFYISHYGSHGSHYLKDRKDYRMPIDVLAKADSTGKLTELGRDVLRRLRLIGDEAEGRFGELTKLGAQQHRQIAQRMVERFPEVFEGSVVVDAKSTVVIPCILSMENALQRLVTMRPALLIRHDASRHDMWYMNQYEKKMCTMKKDSSARAFYQAYAKKYNCGDKLMSKLFTDQQFVSQQVDVEKLAQAIFMLTSNVQNTELRKKLSLYDIFSDEELYNYWKKCNTSWFVNSGFCLLGDGMQPYSQRNLLRQLIQDADSCIALAKPGATLRFGHSSMVAPFATLLDLNGIGFKTDNLDVIEKKGWRSYKIFPVAANIQFVFYRENPDDKDVLVKVLLNENEVRLPLKSETEPYYKWSEVRDYYLKRLAEYHGE